MRSVPELGAALPPTALGKDWQPFRDIVGLTPSRTGVQISLGGYAGLSRSGGSRASSSISWASSPASTSAARPSSYPAGDGSECNRSSGENRPRTR